MDVKLRPYQAEAIEKLRESYRRGHKAPLLVLPTGGGKTLTFNFITKGAAAKGRRVLILVHRQELMTQASKSLSGMGVEHGLIKPGHHGELYPVAVASVQTLDRRLKKTPMHFDLIIIDEAHHAAAATWGRILAHFPRAQILGVTATPCRTDGSGLGKIFDDIVIGPTISELIAGGYLVQPVVYAPPTNLDMTGVKRRGGDYSTKETAERVNKPTITGSAVEHYRRLSPGEPAIAFCASIEHATQVAASFRAAGFSSEMIHGGSEDEVRSDMLNGLASGRIHVLTSVDLISEGTDVPIVSTAILLRPTTSLGLYLQQVGRVLRTSPSKHRALILDHVGSCLKFGLPDDDREWSLEGIERKKSSRDDTPVVRQCKKCFAVWEEGTRCPYCGHINIIEARKIKETEGELKQLTREEVQLARSQKMTEYKDAKSWDECLAIADRRGDNKFWVKKRWGRKFGVS